MLSKFSMGCRAPVKKKGVQKWNEKKRKRRDENIEGWAENPMQQEGWNFEKAVERTFSVESCAEYDVGMLPALHLLRNFLSYAKRALPQEICFSDFCCLNWWIYKNGLK